jgi:2-polyprenyl-3-methyl-5-hydroxy-6-metoxy-1,4-benzoquinol methylase
MDELMKRKRLKSLLRNMNESTPLKEETIAKETILSKTDPNIKELLEVLYLEEDRESSFERFCSGNEFKTMFDEIIRHANINLNVKICEVGAGPGFFAVALAKAGFKNVSILEPNNEWITGTGFIANEAKKYGVRIWNSLDSWYESDELYDLIITKACVHHFDNVCKVAAEIRCKISNNGKWLMFDEFFANSTKELYFQLINHPHASKYGQYEWPYSASLYIQLMQLAGYEIQEIIPMKYKNNYMIRNISFKFRLAGPFTTITNILRYMRLTVLAFSIEKFIINIIGHKINLRLFTSPQLMVFALKKMDFPELPVPLTEPDGR